MSNVQINCLSFDGFRDFIGASEPVPDDEEPLRFVVGDLKPTRESKKIATDLDLEDGEPLVIGEPTRELEPDGLVRIADFVSAAEAFRQTDGLFDAVDEQLIGTLAFPASDVDDAHHRVHTAAEFDAIIEDIESAHGDDAVVMSFKFRPDGGYHVGQIGAGCSLGAVRFPNPAITNGFDSIRRAKLGTFGTVIVPGEYCRDPVLELAHGDSEHVEFDVGAEVER